MNSSISKVAVGPHDVDDPQDPHLDGAVVDPPIPCLDADAEVSNLEVDHALPKKPRVKPTPLRRKKGKLSKVWPKKSPVVPLPPSQPRSIYFVLCLWSRSQQHPLLQPCMIGPKKNSPGNDRIS